MRKFKKGTKVYVTAVIGRSKLKVKNAVGKSLTGWYEDDIGSVLIQFEQHMNGHNGDGEGKMGYCWWCRTDTIKVGIPNEWKGGKKCTIRSSS